MNVLLLAVLLIAGGKVVLSAFGTRRLSHIPTIGGPSFPILSFLATIKFATRARELLQEGYNKYRNGSFKIFVLNRWMVFVASDEMRAELRSAPMDRMSMNEAMDQFLSIRYVSGDAVVDDHYHVAYVKNELTKGIGAHLPAMVDELDASYSDYISAKGDSGWKAIVPIDISRDVACRVTNRLFVGLPLCRNPEWVKLNVAHTITVMVAGELINLCPRILKRTVAAIIGLFNKDQDKALKHLAPVIREHREQHASQAGSSTGETSTMLSWLLAENAAHNRPDRATDYAITEVMLSMNIAAVHTGGGTFAHAMLDLAAHPEYMQPLRTEVEEALKAHGGWTTDALRAMRKVDSFLKESMRLHSVSGWALFRVTLEDYTFQNGTFIPKDTLVAAPTHAVQVDGTYYTDPDEFMPFRFAEQVLSAEEGAKNAFATASTEFIGFGLGRNACPGRFFAAVELKMMMAALVLGYDVRLEGDAKARPEDWVVMGSCMPNPTAKVLIRRRA